MFKMYSAMEGRFDGDGPKNFFNRKEERNEFVKMDIIG